MTWQHLVFIPPFGTLVPLLLAAAGFHCSVTCLVRSPALQQPRQLNLRRVADVDREFRVGSPSTREEMTYYAVSSCPISLGPQLELQEFATLPTYFLIEDWFFYFYSRSFNRNSGWDICFVRIKHEQCMLFIGYDHTMGNTPDPIRTPKLSPIGPG